MMDIRKIKTASPFKDLFPVKDCILKKIVWDMQKNGYDVSKPIVLWHGDGWSILIDGHTRLLAAGEAGIHQVPVVTKAFPNEEAALRYAIKCQSNRRNLTDYEIAKCIETLDKRKNKLANLKQNHTEAPSGASGKTASETAEVLGINHRKVERVRTVLDKAPEEVKEAVKSGNMTINTAYNLTVGKQNKAPKAKKGSPKSLQLAAEEIASVEKIIDIINERLNKEQMRELIKRLVLNFSEKYKDQDKSND